MGDPEPSVAHRRNWFGRWSRFGGAAAGGDHLYGNFGREENFQAALERTFDQLVQRGAAAGADEDFVSAGDGGGFGDHFGGIGAGVVDGNDGHAKAMALLEPLGKEALGGGITFKSQAGFGADGQGDVAGGTDDQEGV